MLYEIFIDTYKAYNILDRKKDLIILEGYGVGPCVCRLLGVYWDRAVMTARDSG